MLNSSIWRAVLSLFYPPVIIRGKNGKNSENPVGSNKSEKRKPKSAVYRSFWASVVYFHLRLISTKSHKREMTRNQVVRKGTWVRIPPLPPKSRNNLDIAGCKPTVPRCCGFFICKISEVQKKMPDRNFFIWMDLNSVFQRIENSDGSQRPFSSQKGRPSTEKLYTKNRVPVCWYQKINRPGFFVFRHKRKRAPSPGKDGNSHGQHTAHLFCGT